MCGLLGAGACLVGGSNAGAAAAAAAEDGSGGGASGGGGGDAGRALLLNALLVGAFSPELAAGRASCPAKVLDEIRRHALVPARSVYAVVQGGSQHGAHLQQRHLQAALAPCGELANCLLTKSRGGGGTLQTAATLAFASPLGCAHP